MADVTKILIAIVVVFWCCCYCSKNAVQEVEVKDFKECRDLYQLWKKFCFQLYLRKSPSEYNMFQEWCQAQTLFNSNIRQKRDVTTSLPEVEALNLVNNSTLDVESVTQQDNDSSVEECSNSSRLSGACGSSNEKESSSKESGRINGKKPDNNDGKKSKNIIHRYESPKHESKRFLGIGIGVPLAILVIGLIGACVYVLKKRRARRMGGGGAVDRAQILAARYRDLSRNEGDVAQGGQPQMPIQRENTDSGATGGEDEILAVQPTEVTTSAASTAESITSSSEHNVTFIRDPEATNGFIL